MKIEDILALTKAGYTKADIMALTAEPEQEAATSEPTIQAEPEPVEVAKTGTIDMSVLKPEAAAVPAAENETITALLAEVQGLKKQLAQHFINTDSLPTVSKEDIATKILGEVINPPKK